MTWFSALLNVLLIVTTVSVSLAAAASIALAMHDRSASRSFAARHIVALGRLLDEGTLARMQLMELEGPRPKVADRDSNRLRRIVVDRARRRSHDAVEIEIRRHVTWNESLDRWDVSTTAGGRVSEHFESQREAVRRASELVAKSGATRGKVVVHGRDGKTRESTVFRAERRRT